MTNKFKEAYKPKTLLARNSVKFNDFAEPQHPNQRPYLWLLGRHLHNTVCEKVCTKTTTKIPGKKFENFNSS